MTLAAARTRRRRHRGFLLIAASFALGLALLPGCGGCGSDEEEQAQQSVKTGAKTGDPKAEEEKKPVEDFTFHRFSMQPYEEERVETYFKPGHWSSAVLDVTANKFDVNGELSIEPFQLDGMPFELGTSRPALLPKEQRKQLELVFFVPPGGGRTSVHARLHADGGGLVYEDTIPVRRMEEHEFLFVVLAAEPKTYDFLKQDETLDAIWPRETLWGEYGLRQPFYRVIRPPVGDRVALPDNALTWTAVAYVLWDGVDPKKLLPEQRQALLDWLHWGGQLIVSGPESLQLLEGSFLEPYLPATAEGDLELDEKRLLTLDKWRRSGRWLDVTKPWAGKRLNSRTEQGAHEIVLATDEPFPLVVERDIGAGRIVLTAFQLNQKELRQWQGFDNFLNSALLRRPLRTFSDRDEATWNWDIGQQMSVARTDARLLSSVRYFTRDAAVSFATFAALELDGSRQTDSDDSRSRSWDEDEMPRGLPPADFDSADDAWEDQDLRSRGAGVAGWSDFNHVSTGGRETLRRSAGIKVPEGGFVLWVVGVYLVVLVPVNWCVFKLLGRVEWAWIAAPVITLIAAGMVVKLAELDIGFARARTEVAVVELQADYPRAHVTRYTALYTSLSTQYDLEFSESTALVQPFPRFTPEEQRQQYLGDIETLNYRHTPDAVSLTGFQVPSNSTGMLHSEHMLDVGGGLRLEQTPGGWQVVNGTSLDLRGVALLKPAGDEAAPDWPNLGWPGGPPEMSAVWIGYLPAGEKREFKSFDLSAADLWQQHRDGDDITAETTRIDVLKLRLLTKLAEDAQTFRPGEVRLVAWSDQELASLEITPAAKELRFANLIIAHLRHGPRPDAVSDDGPRPELVKE